MITEVIELNEKNFAAAIRKAADLILQGQLVAIPTETVYGLGGSALDARAAKAIYEAKGRPCDNPLIVHISEPEQAEKLAYTAGTPFYELAEAFWPGPLTMVLPKKPIVPDSVTGGMDTVAIRLPDHRAARALISASCPIAAPSANRSGLPSPTRALHVLQDMEGRIPLILDGGACRVGVESTVLSLIGEIPMVLRPGGVTPEMLESVLGRVDIHQSALNPLEGKALSPGMKYKHYAPKAQVFVAAGDDCIERACRRDMAEGKKPLVLITRGWSLPERVPCRILGGEGEEERVAAELFDALRACDDEGADTVYVQDVPASGIGLAVMNRLLRAAGFRRLEEI